jgi:spore maturation protein CgeB
MDNQIDVYGHSFIEEAITDKTCQWLSHPEFNRLMNTDCDQKIPKENQKNVVAARLMYLILNRQITNKERILLLTLLAKHHEVKLYSTDKNEIFKDLTFCGPANYYTEMPKIFRHSKINLNATLRSIEHGIPLRCIDIMGCGGCLLTNYQKDFDEHFKDGENVLFFRDAGEALEKANFYLAHDSLREKIALSGRETVEKYYTYPVKIREMLELAGLDYLIKACGK